MHYTETIARQWINKIVGALTKPISTTSTLSVTGAATLGSTLAVTGAITPTGGIAPLATPTGFANLHNDTATSGTDTTPASGTQFVTSLFVPCNFTVSNINFLIGSVGGTDKVYGAIYSSAGALLANTLITGSPAGVTVGTAANIQTMALVTPATLAVKGPTLVFVGISISGNTSRIRTVPAFTSSGIWGGTVSQTHGTVAAITPPSTFTANQAPFVFLS